VTQSNRYAVSPFDSFTVCEWFAYCENRATLTMPHPVLGSVPICERCASRPELAARRVDAVPLTSGGSDDAAPTNRLPARLTAEVAELTEGCQLACSMP